MPAGFIPFLAANIQDALGNKLAAGTLEVLPTDTQDRPIDCSCGGVLLSVAASVAVTNGAIPAGTVIPLSSATLPPNVCFRITIRDTTGKQLIAIPLVQPTGTQFNLDTYQPNVAPQAIVQYGPPGSAGPPGVPGPPGTVTTTGVGGGFEVVGTLKAGEITYEPIGTRYLLCEGDSETAGFLLSDPASHSWPAQLAATPYFNERCTLVNSAIPGSTYQSMTARYASAVKPYKPNGSTITQAFLFVMIGRNNLGESASSINAGIDAYITQAKADGFTVILLTILPSSLQVIGPTAVPVMVTSASQVYTSGPTGLATIVAANDFTGSGSEYVYLSGFTGAAAALNGYVGTVLPTGLSSSQFAVVTGPQAPYGAVAQAAAHFAQTAYSSWDFITTANELVRQQVNDHILRSTLPDVMIDVAAWLANPDDTNWTFDGTHPQAIFYSLMAKSIGSYFGPTGSYRVPQGLNSFYSPKFQGLVQATRLSVVQIVNGIMGDASSAPYASLYYGPTGPFLDAVDPTSASFIPLVLRASSIQISDSGNQNVVIDGSGFSATRGGRGPNFFAGGTGAMLPTSGQYSYIGTDVTPFLRAYDFTAGGEVSLRLRGSPSVQLVVNAVIVAQALAASLQVLALSTISNGVSTASPAACGSAPSGQVQIANGATSLTVNTTAVTASSRVTLTLSVAGITPPTNMASLVAPYLSAISPGASFTMTLPVAPSGNPVNVHYGIVN